jgi:hypothetical protein
MINEVVVGPALVVGAAMGTAGYLLACSILLLGQVPPGIGGNRTPMVESGTTRRNGLRLP